MKKLNSLILEQKEDAKHGESFFPIQKYITSLTPEYPVLTTHWHEEAEFTLITEGQGTYYIELMEYGVEPEDLVFVMPLALHAASAPEGHGLLSETYVFHMNFLGGNSTDICSTRYLHPLARHEMALPGVIKPAAGNIPAAAVSGICPVFRRPQCHPFRKAENGLGLYGTALYGRYCGCRPCRALLFQRIPFYAFF